MKSIYLLLCICLVTLSCNSSKYKITNNQLKAFEDLIASKEIKIESDKAYPQITNAMQQVLNSGIMQPGNSSGLISLIGNSNFLTISGDSVSSYLPYFGERQMHAEYGGGDSAIQLNSIMTNYSVKKEKNHSYAIQFDAKNKYESYTIRIKLFPNFKTDMQVIGTFRQPISYSGSVKSTNYKN